MRINASSRFARPVCRPAPGRIGLLTAAVAGAIVLGAPVAVATARATGAPPEPMVLKNKRPVRRPVIDLDKSAKEVRVGQVVPEGEAVREDAAAPGAGASGTAAGLVAAASKTHETALVSAAPMSPAGAERTRATGENPSPGAADAADPPVSATGAPVKVVVLSAYSGEGEISQAQWRPLAGAGAAPGDVDASWRAMEAGARTEERVEIRTGLSGSARIEIDGTWSMQIDRLSRVRVERRARADVSELSIELVRGRVEVQPIKADDVGQGAEPIRIRTTDAILLRRTGVSITYDAFKGTREAALARR